VISLCDAKLDPTHNTQAKKAIIILIIITNNVYLFEKVLEYFLY